ncbi:MAG: hypothetical protein ACRYG8_17850 [Janthinobacterium lividum]
MIGDVLSAVAPAQRVPTETVIGRVLAAVNHVPSNAADIASRCGLSRVAASHRLSCLVKRGCIQRVGYGLFTLSSSEAAVPVPTQALGRPQPVRDQILAFLTEPRQAFEVAAHTGRRTATITGHMRAMLKLNLVVRVGYGRYARPEFGYLLPSMDALVRQHPVCEKILALLEEPRNATEIAAQLQRPVSLVRDRLRAMQTRGLVRCIRNQVFIRMYKHEPDPTHSLVATTAA